MKLVFNWFVNLFIIWSNFIETVYGTAISYAQDDDITYPDYDYTGPEDVEPDSIVPQTSFPNSPKFVPPTVDFEISDDAEMGEFGVRACDRKVDLYILQPDRLNTSGQSNPLKGKLTNCHVTGCERPFSVQKVPHSNLILLVVDTLCPCGSKQLSITPQELVYDTNGGCLHKPKDSLYRKRPPKCINYHPEEIEIHICGSAYSITGNFLLLMVLLICSRIVVL